LSSTPVIVAIARDPALLRSLAFALEAHGYGVAAFASWGEAGEAAGAASLVILDDGLPGPERKACLSLKDRGVPVLLLTGNHGEIERKPGLGVLAKPLSGADVVEAVAALRRNP
jgi:DNA-binding response OmpR family regulator